MTKTIEVPRGANIGKTIIASFINFNKVSIKTIDVVRKPKRRVNVVYLQYFMN